MKNLMLAMLLSTVWLMSCTQTLYTHDEYMGRFKTQQDLTAKFGIPTEKMTGDSTEQWLYRFERASFRPKPGEPIYVPISNADTRIVTKFTRYDKFILFSFDKHGHITGQHVKGVDLGAKQISAGKTIGLIGGLAVTILVLGLIYKGSSVSVAGYTAGP